MGGNMNISDYKKTLSLIRFYKKLLKQGKIKTDGTASKRLKQLLKIREEGFYEEGIGQNRRITTF